MNIPKAIKDMNEARTRHILWAVHQIKQKEKGLCHVSCVGDVNHHVSWATKYENVIDILNKIKK